MSINEKVRDFCVSLFFDNTHENKETWKSNRGKCVLSPRNRFDRSQTGSEESVSFSCSRNYQSPDPFNDTTPDATPVTTSPDVTVTTGQPGQSTTVDFFAPRSGTVTPAVPTVEVGLNESATPQ